MALIAHPAFLILGFLGLLGFVDLLTVVIGVGWCRVLEGKVLVLAVLVTGDSNCRSRELGGFVLLDVES